MKMNINIISTGLMRTGIFRVITDINEIQVFIEKVNNWAIFLRIVNFQIGMYL
ncbi:hypothetical protein ABGT22_27265 [Peribacillus frigoritolerans]|uniref:hypothetical protein n=1 Tax=Peribacillus frigoritolerans TaxID=450367 RepID=UPI00345DD4F7